MLTSNIVHRNIKEIHLVLFCIHLLNRKIDNGVVMKECERRAHVYHNVSFYPLWSACGPLSTLHFPIFLVIM